MGGGTYINLLDQIVPYLEQNGYDIELDDIRDYGQSFTFEKVDEQTFSSATWPTGHPKAGEPVILRDYQIDITNQFLSNPQCVQEVATGAGKCLAKDTLLSLSIDENTPFGKFIINKLRQEMENNVTENNNKL